MNKVVPKMTLDEALKNDLGYPNINIFTVPFKTSLGRVYLRDSMYDDAIKTFHKARLNNPFLLINENYLAETFLTINQKDSFNLYAKKIFKNAPNHPSHFAFYIKSLEEKLTSSKIDSAFNLISYKSQTIWKFYLASIYNVENRLDDSKKNMKIADSLFPKDKEIQYLLDVIKFGQEKIKKSQEFISAADELAKLNDFEGSLKILNEALKLHPNNNDILDKISTLFFKLEQYDSSLMFINRIDINKYNDLGRYNLIKGINLAKLGDRQQGCRFIYEAILKGNKEAIKANRSYCN
tara:strand:- start:207 stop:1088 length:882 start_codon:yes stop_codon:yes gene_type:complete